MNSRGPENCEFGVVSPVERERESVISESKDHKLTKLDDAVFLSLLALTAPVVMKDSICGSRGERMDAHPRVSNSSWRKID